ncbi:MAG TPA: ProQ/FinO family protein [Burkholderiaceae bacterium]|jgi:sRNA-binding protein|nr:ProQ/FinO family protein [Burkholderiaceae bacterium]
MSSEPSQSPSPEPLTPARCAALLKQLFPAVFADMPKPLKLGVRADIQAKAPGQFPRDALSAFLRRHTTSTAYLVALTKAEHRFDLEGAASGEISDEHRQAAADELERRRANRRPPPRAAIDEQQRRQRAELLRDFERTTLTPANFCALKGIALDELEGLLSLARREAASSSSQKPRERRRP